MNSNFPNNIVRQKHFITRIKREKKYGHKSIVIWFTGLSGSGKSTIANYLEKILFKNGIHTYVLDGDNIRLGLCSDLNFTIIDREENIRRIGEVAKLMLDSGIITLVSVISPYIHQRKMVYKILGKKNFLEIFVDTPIHICENRDPKKLYKKARMGKISNFTGINDLYERPETADVHLDGTDSLQNSAKKLIKVLHDYNIISFMGID
ncbi:adenylyl-sulfate kinase [Buchnera aphidicola]|uniref:Adenylyl-sulfate kinase n=1 Tax=Buchnera aphidicola str. USDA (Myzus persicae) TaxID=1009856 RepID=W0P4G5_BUCMP|nr:adenylyl-sulfate kinase [Buchnera aphidicola]AHG59973.1 Cysc [Buchnera aphidicola str. USDA (Myzus persicae)]AHG60553.1 Cysc [Buchnera aphidicola str. W106 (Myzus persicae)]AHG61126.1 Cysc [Buchnera aphidicola str. G002 (Myzus persicae)]AHG61698.1 Cysc [Buchnera aphidicola str. F009 (Myzus persicae)]WAI03345.1 MAG: adenylyl-sulfate kinase [Buchnera aphidicola (Myzus persicae)]